jgi:hypothetical protein
MRVICGGGERCVGVSLAQQTAARATEATGGCDPGSTTHEMPRTGGIVDPVDRIEVEGGHNRLVFE